ncbi:MAG: ShlB/FhaC/HecB family hemolysin secretion/activation protein [Candidatus Competibacter sp.]|nr:ShlB/FhaC/HecB family hemolysin secretion/activation protein [Candidatus Competibacter sp.]MDG4584161.1 ShlB/FhaC/HecB family hemolysin secretion/activation protein [Candidatus Competibacter sp.]
MRGHRGYSVFHVFMRWLSGCAAIALMALPPFAALGQDENLWEQRPGGRNLTAPDYARPVLVLPGLPAPEPSLEPPLSVRERVFVRRFDLSGNTVFGREELATVTAPYENRTLSAEELQEARRQLTLYYVERGYLNSGAVIPDQRVEDGVVRIHIVEGRLSAIDISGNTYLRADYLQDRLQPDVEEPLNVLRLQERLQLLQQNPRIEQLQAELAPGVQPGEGRLRLGIREARPYEIGLAVANNNPPSVGATRAYLYGLDRNLSGVGDTLGLNYGHSLESSGTADWRAFYARPLNARDTTVQVWAERNDTSVIEDRFSALDIVSELQSYGIALTHSLYRTPRRNLSLGVNLEWRHSESFLLGIPFSFAPGENNGEATVTVARFIQEWLDRGLNQVIAARSTLSVGLDAFGATVGDRNPDGRFVSWLGQFQWARRFGERDEQLLFKSILQLASDPLLSMEKCALGGMETVRGYPENTLVRDRCFVASLEFRTPVYRLPLPGVSRGPHEGQVQLAVFADYGYAKNKGEFDLEPNSISSAGAGIRWDASDKVQAALYWGYPFRDVNTGEEAWAGSRVNFFVQAAY